MGMIDRFIGIAPAARGLSDAATDMAEMFRENATRRMELNEDAYRHAMSQFGVEFSAARRGWFDGFVNGLNRLPRPLMTFGTLAMFVYAMAEPAGFAQRMAGLQSVPEPLWWLLGAIVSFYFGAREAHYFRNRPRNRRIETPGVRQNSAEGPEIAVTAPAGENFPDNAALRDWSREKQAFSTVF